MRISLTSVKDLVILLVRGGKGPIADAAWRG